MMRFHPSSGQGITVSSTTLQAFAGGLTFREYCATLVYHKRHVVEHYQQLDRIPAPEKEVLKSIANRFRKLNILIITEDWCPDCVLNVPVVIRMAEFMGNAEARVARRSEIPDVALGYLGYDGKNHLPTVVLWVKDTGRELGYWSERSTPERVWLDKFLERNPAPPIDTRSGTPSQKFHRWTVRRIIAEREIHLEKFWLDTIRELTMLLLSSTDSHA